MQQWNRHLRLVWKMAEKQDSFSLGKIISKKKTSNQSVYECLFTQRRASKTSLNLVIVRLIATRSALTLGSRVCLHKQRYSLPKMRLFAPNVVVKKSMLPSDWGNFITPCFRNQPVNATCHAFSCLNAVIMLLWWLWRSDFRIFKQSSLDSQTKCSHFSLFRLNATPCATVAFTMGIYFHMYCSSQSSSFCILLYRML